MWIAKCAVISCSEILRASRSQEHSKQSIYDDALHFASAMWAAIAAYTSRKASEIFLKVFGTLYFFDGLMGLVTGSGFLDLGIVLQGWQSLPILFKARPPDAAGRAVVAALVV